MTERHDEWATPPEGMTELEERTWFHDRFRARVQNAVDEYCQSPYTFDVKNASVAFPGPWIIILDMLAGNGVPTFMTASADHMSMHLALGLLESEAVKLREAIKNMYTGVADD